MDEARCGLKIWYRRRWCPVGTRPPWIYADRDDWRWFYAAVEPTTGQSCCLFLPRLDSACFAWFVHEWRQTYRPRLILADEPTGNLDPDTAHDVLMLLRDEIKANGASGIIVTHSHAAAATADRVLELTRSGLHPVHSVRPDHP